MSKIYIVLCFQQVQDILFLTLSLHTSANSIPYIHQLHRVLLKIRSPETTTHHQPSILFTWNHQRPVTKSQPYVTKFLFEGLWCDGNCAVVFRQFRIIVALNQRLQSHQWHLLLFVFLYTLTFIFTSTTSCIWYVMQSFIP